MKHKKQKECLNRGDLTTFESLSKQHIRPLIELNDKINSLTASEQVINSTRIVVVGDQSHGKTSLLEAISGVDLPRGEGIQTRVPLVLQLRETITSEEYALIKIASSNSSAERISLDKIGSEVYHYTKKAAGQGKDVKDEPIELKIFRRDQDDLTLIDLPGITRVALSDQAGGDGKKLETLILGMCRRYITPEESIVLNVVSAMVDFSTSASLQLSRELDPEGKRTLLCVTKVDQHQEEGLHDKITTAIETMGIPSQMVYAVRNRTASENKNNLPLVEVRRLEMIEMEKMFEHRSEGKYGLGMEALSKQLVRIQYENICETLPLTRLMIEERVKVLQHSIDALPEYIADAVVCRSKAAELIDACVCCLKDQIHGHASLENTFSNVESCEGKSLELSLVVKDWKEARKKDCGNASVLYSEEKFLGAFSFQLELHCRTDGEDENSVGLFLIIEVPKGEPIKKMIVDYSCSAFCEGDEIVTESTSNDFIREQIWGWEPFISEDEADDLSGKMTFTAFIYVDKVTSESEDIDRDGRMLCAQLSDLQDEFLSNIESLHSNHFFFSEHFRKSLAKDIIATRGGLGLPGSVAPHLPIVVLKRLRKNLAKMCKEYRQSVFQECKMTATAILCNCIKESAHPQLLLLLEKKMGDVFEEQMKVLGTHHASIIEWEDSMHSSNHYFMDTVQSIRENIFDDGSATPSYLADLDPERIKFMSNEEQKLVDMQIEIFAYWKLMKKRFVDNIIMSTHSELVSKPIYNILKESMIKVALCKNDEDMVSLLSPAEDAVEERTFLCSRLKKLVEALELLEGFDETVMPRVLL
uniref:Dynamin GTPase n=2 Tax=Helicotheca tamesis TaxID=374047 RepID=A0A7S2N5B3_9STRA|mmetsp:Transcript_976/g.1372  ORF Transcript_976/g.1372 Transcript_976/m.1372 type:complete len:814 (+) Transcript_976:84-2525(+)